MVGVYRVGLDGNNCVVLETGGATQLSTIWPHGYTASVSADGLLTIYDAERRPVADGGATIETSGGFHTVTDQHTVQNGTGTVPIIGGSHDCTPAGTSPFVIQAPPDVTQGVMTATPASTSPGQTIELAFSAGTTRGIGFTLTSEDGTVYTLFSGRNGADPYWEKGRAVMPSIGFEGPGPDHVLIPEDAASGRYELCSGGNIGCTTITVS